LAAHERGEAFDLRFGQWFLEIGVEAFS
jgi:hypothetical protein